jgi:protein ImuA
MPMIATGIPEALTALRRLIVEPKHLIESAGINLDMGTLDAALGGGLPGAALHEIAPATPMHHGAAIGFAAALAGLAAKHRETVVWIQQDFAAYEAGRLYGPGFDHFGLDSDHLVIVRAGRATDVLFAMEEALKCRAVGSVVAELSEAGTAADLTATRRLSLAARESCGIGLLLRQRLTDDASTAVTRWQVRAAPGPRDQFGGLGRTTFSLSLLKNRRGTCGEWTLCWNHHDRVFFAADSVRVAAAATDRPDRALFARAG